MFQQIFKLSFVFFNAYVQNYWREAGGGGGGGGGGVVLWSCNTGH